MIDEINAEMLLEQLYPELETKWTARHKGTFYRNYSPDAMASYPDEHLVELARDSMLKLLPREMLSNEHELAKKDINGKNIRKDINARKEEMKARLHLLNEAFMPLDTFNFRRKLTVERHVEDILDKKLEYILKTHYNFDIKAKHDEYVLQAAMLLPYLAKMRGDSGLVRNMLSVITGYKVRVRQSAFSDYDNSRAWMPKLNFDIIIPDLAQEDYLAMTAKFTPLIDFVIEHFVPYDVVCDVQIKSLDAPKETSLLNYNSYV